MQGWPLLAVWLVRMNAAWRHSFQGEIWSHFIWTVCRHDHQRVVFPLSALHGSKLQRRLRHLRCCLLRTLLFAALTG